MYLRMYTSRLRPRAWITVARRLLVWMIVFTAAQHAVAQMPATVLLEDMTWTELKEQIQSGKTTILVPIGGTEQNGPAITLGKHNVRAKFLAEKIAQRLGNAIVAPVIAYVPEGNVEPPTSHMRFPGTITVSDDVFTKTLESAARSFKSHGFRDIVFLGDHGGYQRTLPPTANRLNREWARTTTRAHAPEEYYGATLGTYEEQLRRRGFKDAEIGTHAGLADTSLQLLIDPHAVRLERLRSGIKLGASEGVYGVPHRATAELGQLGVDAVIAETVEAIKKSIVGKRK